MSGHDTNRWNGGLLPKLTAPSQPMRPRKASRTSHAIRQLSREPADVVKTSIVLASGNQTYCPFGSQSLQTTATHIARPSGCTVADVRNVLWVGVAISWHIEVGNRMTDLTFPRRSSRRKDAPRMHPREGQKITVGMNLYLFEMDNRDGLQIQSRGDYHLAPPLDWFGNCQARSREGARLLLHRCARPKIESERCRPTE